MRSARHVIPTIGVSVSGASTYRSSKRKATSSCAATAILPRFRCSVRTRCSSVWAIASRISTSCLPKPCANPRGRSSWCVLSAVAGVESIRTLSYEVLLRVRFCEVRLQAPNHSSQPPVHLWAVYLHESAAEDSGEPIEWLLLTSVAVTTFEHAVQRAEWYASTLGY